MLFAGTPHVLQEPKGISKSRYPSLTPSFWLLNSSSSFFRFSMCRSRMPQKGNGRKGSG